MKHVIILCVVFLAGCSNNERKDWDSGADAKKSYQIERQEEMESDTTNQFPSPRKPTTEMGQPF